MGSSLKLACSQSMWLLFWGSGSLCESFVIDLHVRVDKRSNQANLGDLFVLDHGVINDFRGCEFPASYPFNEGWEQILKLAQNASNRPKDTR